MTIEESEDCDMNKRLYDRPRRRGWVALFVVTTLVIVTRGYAYYTHEIERVRQEKYDDIAAIAKLKVGSIQAVAKRAASGCSGLINRAFVE